LEIKRAINFQKVCSFILLHIDHFSDFYNTFGPIEAENALIQIASILKKSVSAEDKVARFADHEFALILPGVNEQQAIDTAERIRKNMEDHTFQVKGTDEPTICVKYKKNIGEGDEKGVVFEFDEEVSNEVIKSIIDQN